METATTPESQNWYSDAAGFAVDSPYIWDSGAQENTYDFIPSPEESGRTVTLTCQDHAGMNTSFSGRLYTVSRSQSSTFDPPNAGIYGSSELTGIFV